MFYELKKYIITLNYFCSLLDMNYSCSIFNLKKSYIYIYRKLKFVFKLHNILLTIFGAFSLVLKKYAFYTFILGFIFLFVNFHFCLDIFIYIYTMSFLVSFIFVLVLIINICDQKNWFKRTYIKYILYLLLWVSVGVFLYVFLKLISSIFVFITTKLWNIKDLIKKSLSNKNENPRNSDFNIYSQDSRNKKKKYLQQRAQEMRDKVLSQQKYTKNITQSFNRDSLSAKRGITKKIFIEPRQDLNIETQLDRIKNELEAYNIQERKFKSWSKGKGKDFTYPEQAQELFKEYSRILKDLRPSLKSMKKQVKKQLKK